MTIFGILILEYGGYGGSNANTNVGYVDYSQPPPSAGGYNQNYGQNNSWNQGSTPAGSYSSAQGKNKFYHLIQIHYFVLNYMLKSRFYCLGGGGYTSPPSTGSYNSGSTGGYGSGAPSNNYSGGASNTGNYAGYGGSSGGGSQGGYGGNSGGYGNSYGGKYSNTKYLFDIGMVTKNVRQIVIFHFVED